MMKGARFWEWELLSDEDAVVVPEVHATTPSGRHSARSRLSDMRVVVGRAVALFLFEALPELLAQGLIFVYGSHLSCFYADIWVWEVVVIFRFCWKNTPPLWLLVATGRWACSCTVGIS